MISTIDEHFIIEDIIENDPNENVKDQDFMDTTEEHLEETSVTKPAIAQLMKDAIILEQVHAYLAPTPSEVSLEPIDRTDRIIPKDVDEMVKDTEKQNEIDKGDEPTIIEKGQETTTIEKENTSTIGMQIDAQEKEKEKGSEKEGEKERVEEPTKQHTKAPLPPTILPSESALSSHSKKIQKIKKEKTSLDEEIIIPICDQTKMNPDEMMKDGELLKRKGA